MAIPASNKTRVNRRHAEKNSSIKKYIFKGIDEGVRIIAENISDIRATFEEEDEWILSDLGGTFVPTCIELQHAAAGTPDVARFDTAGGVELAGGENCILGSFVHRLYYETLRRATNFEFFRLRIGGSGIFQIIISAENDSNETPVFFGTINIDGEYLSPPIEINTLPANGSLVVQMRCLSETGAIRRIRWQGLVRKWFANTGDRIIAIRTFGNLASVRSSLSAIMERLNETHQDVLKRYLFIIYDATAANGDQPVLGESANGRIIELKGGNYGGGGNASALLSLIVRAGVKSAHEVAEVVLLDDDAHIDADSLVRHDGFITARKAGFVSTSVVYSRQNPARIQEFGGIWGRYFSTETYRVDITRNDAERIFIPYLVRANRNVNNSYDIRYIGRHQEIDFSTFIFISFPFALLQKAGVPLPFFLRNDDCEICLRMKEHGAKVVVNPNLSAWHESAHNVIGEFYAVLHSLIINLRFGGLSRTYVLRFFMERLSRLSATRNLPLMTAYVRILELFLAGPEWMDQSTIYDKYGHVRRELADIMANDAANLPFEVVDTLKNKNKFDIISLVDPLGAGNTGGPAVFIDPKDESYYFFASATLDSRIELLLRDGTRLLASLSESFESTANEWLKWQKEFDHYAFWNSLLGSQEPSVVKVSQYVPQAAIRVTRRVTSDEVRRGQRIKMVDAEDKATGKPVQEEVTPQAEFVQEDGILPADFDPERYYRFNPDVLAAGMAAEEHWINHGRFENRNY